MLVSSIHRVHLNTYFVNMFPVYLNKISNRVFLFKYVLVVAKFKVFVTTLAFSSIPQQRLRTHPMSVCMSVSSQVCHYALTLEQQNTQIEKHFPLNSVVLWLANAKLYFEVRERWCAIFGRFCCCLLSTRTSRISLSRTKFILIKQLITHLN